MSIFKILSAGLTVGVAYDYAKEKGLIPLSIMSFSNSVQDLLKSYEYEGWEQQLNNPNSDFYKVQDIGDGALTVGWGLTHHKNGLFRKKITHIGQKFTLNELTEMYKSVIKDNEMKLKERFKNITIPQRVFNALNSAFYNLENGLFYQNGNETNFYIALKNKDFEAARQNFDFWKMNGQVIRGLVIRRMFEHSIWLGIKPKSKQYYNNNWLEFSQTKNINLL